MSQADTQNHGLFYYYSGTNDKLSSIKRLNSRDTPSKDTPGTPHAPRAGATAIWANGNNKRKVKCMTSTKQIYPQTHKRWLRDDEYLWRYVQGRSVLTG